MDPRTKRTVQVVVVLALLALALLLVGLRMMENVLQRSKSGPREGTVSPEQPDPETPPPRPAVRSSPAAPEDER